MNDLNAWCERLTKAEHRPAIAAIVTSIVFCVWNIVFDPRFYVRELSSILPLTGDKVVDAELFRAVGNLLLIAVLAAIIRLVYRQPLSDYGLGIGDWSRERLVLLATPLALLLGYLGAQQAAYQAHYPDTPGLASRSPQVFLLHIVVLLTFYIAWELLFRGFLQSSLLPRLGATGAIAVQTLASSIAHADRPDSEMLGSILIGLVWGYLAYRTRSIWPVVMQHFLLGLSLDYFLCFG